MIVKRIQKKRQAGFKSLAAYVINAKDGGRGDPVDWKLGQYVLDDPHAGEKVAWAHATNCHADDLGIAVKEIMATQALNKTARTDLNYHLVVSFPAGERPTREQLENIEQELCDAIGMGDHQRIAAVHQNTDNWHMHVAINRVHPQTLRAIEPHQDYPKMQAACIELEIKHDLTRDNHGRAAERSLRGKAADMEAHSGRISFARWMAENAAAPIIARSAAARSWSDLHAAMADYGLVIKPRGAGLIISADDRVRIKASAIDRSLSIKALTDRFGPYEPPAPELSEREPIMRYTAMPRGASPGLWEKYQQERQQAQEAKAAAAAALRAAHLRYTHQLNAWYRQRYANAKAAHLNRGDRISTKRTLDSSRVADHARRRAREAEDRQAIKDRHAIPTWEGFLAREAGRGDRLAQVTLESRADALIRTEAERTGGRGGRD
jgi:hypothetical protein